MLELNETIGTGPVAPPSLPRQKLNEIRDANVLSLRAGYFMESTLPQGTLFAWRATFFLARSNQISSCR